LHVEKAAMKSPLLVAATLFALPAAAFAQVSHSRAYVTGPLVAPAAPAYVEPYYSPNACTDLQSRKAVLDDEKVTYDRERDQLDAENARLADQLRNLNSADAAAVAAYNARSDAHNQRVAEHNRRVADMNEAVAQLTADIANATPYCRFAWNYGY
jgi:hypothetical protein